LKTLKPKFRVGHLFSRWLVLLIAGHFSHHLLTALPIPLLPFIRDEFGLDYAKSGLLLSVFSIAYGLSQLPSGWLADRLGARSLLTAGVVGVAVMGLVIYFTPGYLFLLICLGLMGLVGGSYHPAAPPLVCATVPPRNRGRALGMHAIGGSASFFVAPLLAGVTAIWWGWRASFLAMAIPTLIFGIILYVALGKFKPAYRLQPVPEVTAKGATSGIKKGHLLGFVIASATGSIIMASFISFIPLLLVDHLKLTQGTAAAMLAVIYFTGIWANPVVGHLADRFGRARLLLLALLTGAPGLYLFFAVHTTWGIVSLLVVFGIIIATLQTSAETHIMISVAPSRCSSVLGAYYFATAAGGGLFVPALGALIDRQGFAVSFSLCAGILACAGLAYGLWQWRQKSLQRAADLK
jgi:MFS family permease